MAKKDVEDYSNNEYEPVGGVDFLQRPTEKDLENSLAFEGEFLDGRSWFEIHRQDPVNAASTRFVAKFEMKPDEGWEKYIQSNYADRELQTSKWRVWLKNGVDPRTGAALNKQSKAFAVEPSIEALQRMPYQAQGPGGSNIIINPQGMQQQAAQQQPDEFKELASESIKRILDRAIEDRANPNKGLTELVSAMKAIKEVTGSSEQVQPQQDTSMEKAMMLFKMFSESIPKPKDDTKTILELLNTQNQIVRTYETELRRSLEERLNSNPKNENSIDSAISELEKTVKIAEMLGYTKGDDQPQKDSTDKWLEALQEGLKVVGPAIGTLATGLGGWFMNRNNNQIAPQPYAGVPQPNPQIHNPQMMRQPQIIQSNPQMPQQPNAMGTAYPPQQAYAQPQQVQTQASALEIISLVKSLKSSVSKLDADKDYFEESLSRVIADIEDLPGQREKLDAINEPVEMSVYLSDVIDGIANNQEINNNLFKLSVVMGSIEGQKWKAAFLDFAKGYFFETDDNAKDTDSTPQDAKDVQKESVAEATSVAI